MEEEKKISDDDKIYCESIGKSISNIIRFSFNEEFRKNCFQMLGVFSTKQAEKEISKRLISLIEKQNSDGKKVSKSSTFKDTEKENEQACNDFLEENQNEESPSTSSDPQPTSENFPTKKSWLEISSQQFRDVVKKRKTQYYSQPLFTDSFHKNFEHSSNRLHFSNSQPAFECSNSVFNDTKENSWNLSGDGNEFNNEKFETPFNFQKYFN